MHCLETAAKHFSAFCQTDFDKPEHWPRSKHFDESRHDRKRVEMLFANLKRIFRLSRPT
jgi:hypothetical protein